MPVPLGQKLRLYPADPFDSAKRQQCPIRSVVPNVVVGCRFNNHYLQYIQCTGGDKPRRKIRNHNANGESGGVSVARPGLHLRTLRFGGGAAGGRSRGFGGGYWEYFCGCGSVIGFCKGSIQGKGKNCGFLFLHHFVYKSIRQVKCN